MVSGAGATINQLFGLPVTLGCALMAVAVFISVAFGLKRIIEIISIIGPAATVFTVFVAIYAIAVSPVSLSQAGELMQTVNFSKASNFWWLSGVLYVAYNVTGSVPFLTSLGAQGNTKKEITLGALLGSIIVMGGAILLIIPHMLYAPQIENLQIPNLYLAELISPICGFIFAVCLILQIFSTASPMLWTTCNKFTAEGSKQNKILALILSVIAFFGGQLPFSTLVGIVYPYMGYIGIFFFICVLVRQLFFSKKEDSAQA